MYGHLGAGMQGELRNSLTGQPEQTQILNNGGVGPSLVQKMKEPDRLLNLAVLKKGIHCNVNPDTPNVGKMNRPAEFKAFKVTGGVPGVEKLAPKVNSIRPVFHGGYQGFPIAGRR